MVYKTDADPARIKKLVAAQSDAKGASQWVCCISVNQRYLAEQATYSTTNNSIKKPKTSRYPSLKGTDPKFRRNHRHALHGNMKALVGFRPAAVLPHAPAQPADSLEERSEG